MSWNARISVPSQAVAGDIVSIRTLISHPMETGFRRAPDGRPIPRDILVLFECRFNQQLVFQGQLAPGIAANPYLRFAFKATESGTFEFLWRDQHGVEHRDQRQLQVTTG